MRAFAGAVMIEQQRALVEERGLRRIQIFRLGARLHRPPAEGDDAARAVVDRKHHPVAEPVVRHGDVFSVDEQARVDHRLGADALGGERVAQREALGRGVAEPKALLHRRAEAAIGEIAARFGADRRLQVRFEQARRHRHNFDQARALLVLSRLRGAQTRHRQAGHVGQPLDRFREGEALGLHQKGERVAVLAGREVVEEALLVVDEERRRLLRAEWREAPPLAPFLAQFDARPRHLRDRQAGPDLVEKFGRKLHGEPDWPWLRLWQGGRARCPPPFAGRAPDRSAKRPRVEKGARNVGMGEVVAHEQKRFASGLRVGIDETIAEVEVGPMTHDLAETGGRLHRLACEIWRHRGLFRLERFAELDDRRQRRRDVLARDGALAPDPGSRQPKRRLEHGHRGNREWAAVIFQCSHDRRPFGLLGEHRDDGRGVDDH